MTCVCVCFCVCVCLLAGWWAIIHKCLCFFFFYFIGVVEAVLISDAINLASQRTNPSATDFREHRKTTCGNAAGSVVRLIDRFLSPECDVSLDR